MFVKRIGIIGTGPSGLAVIKACLEEGLEPSAFEREGELGNYFAINVTILITFLLLELHITSTVTFC